MKLPKGRPVNADAIVPEPSIGDSPHLVILDKITAQSVRKFALRTEGAASPSGAGARHWLWY